MQTAHAEKASWVTGNDTLFFTKNTLDPGTKFFKEPHFSSSCILVEYSISGSDKAVCGQKLAHNWAPVEGKGIHEVILP